MKYEAAMKFHLEKKSFVVKVKYYEHLFFIRDEDGEMLFAGMDERRAREVCTLLNAYHKKEIRRVKAKPIRKALQSRDRKSGGKSRRR